MRKKRLLQLTAALLCAVILSACGGAPADADYTCTVSISCATILDNMDQCAESKKELVPADGVILPPTEVAFAEGESAFDVLQRVCRDNGIHLESKFTPVYNSAYIRASATSTSSTWASCPAGCTPSTTGSLTTAAPCIRCRTAT